jgi:hypothetical protein
MAFPCSTGEGARIIGTTEPLLAETVRRGKVKPEPRIVAGRRLWTPDQLLDAAKVLGLLTKELEMEIWGKCGCLSDNEVIGTEASDERE